MNTALPQMLERGIANFKDHGRAWLDVLPSVIERLATEWAVDVGGCYEKASCSFTAPVGRTDGSTAVLKIPIPHEEAEHESDALAFWDGRGAVRMLEYDRTTGAMLLERCDSGTPLAITDADISLVGGTLLRELHRTPVPDHPFRSLRDVWHEWAALTRERLYTLGRREDVGLIERGVDLLETLPDTSTRDVVLHADFHHWNILSSRREPWLVIDPKPMVGDPLFDCAQFLGNRFGAVDQDVHAFQRELDAFSEGSGFARDEMLVWAFARECENAMWYLSIEDAAFYDPAGSGGSIAYAQVLFDLARAEGAL